MFECNLSGPHDENTTHKNAKYCPKIGADIPGSQFVPNPVGGIKWFPLPPQVNDKYIRFKVTILCIYGLIINIYASQILQSYELHINLFAKLMPLSSMCSENHILSYCTFYHRKDKNYFLNHSKF